jgi:hypothetical protein
MIYKEEKHEDIYAPNQFDKIVFTYAGSRVVGIVYRAAINNEWRVYSAEAGDHPLTTASRIESVGSAYPISPDEVKDACLDALDKILVSPYRYLTSLTTMIHAWALSGGCEAEVSTYAYVNGHWFSTTVEKAAQWQPAGSLVTASGRRYEMFIDLDRDLFKLVDEHGQSLLAREADIAEIVKRN